VRVTCPEIALSQKLKGLHTRDKRMTMTMAEVEVAVAGTISLKKPLTGMVMPAVEHGTLNQLMKRLRAGVTRKHLSPATKLGAPLILELVAVAAGEHLHIRYFICQDYNKFIHNSC
jgi:hypothetical protein